MAAGLLRRYLLAGQNNGRLVRVWAGFDRPELERVVKIRPKNSHYFFRIFRSLAMRALAAALPFFNFPPRLPARLPARFFRRFVPAFAFFLLRRRPRPPALPPEPQLARLAGVIWEYPANPPGGTVRIIRRFLALLCAQYQHGLTR